jgi:hypothetical protein
MSELSEPEAARGPSGAGAPRDAGAVVEEVLASLRRRWARAEVLTPAEAVAAGALAPERVTPGPADRLPGGARVLRVERTDPAAGPLFAAVPLTPARLAGSDPATLADALHAELTERWAAARRRRLDAGGGGPRA